MNTKQMVCFDNGGETWDRYTILDKATGAMIGASEQPFHPQGFGQYVGNAAHNYWVTAYGHGWNRTDPETLKKRVKFGIRHFLNDCSHIGKVIPFDQLPPDVRKFAVQTFTQEAPKLTPGTTPGVFSFVAQDGLVMLKHGL